MNDLSVLTYKNNKKKYLLIVLSFLTMTVISSYNAFFTFNAPFPSTAIFMLLHFFAITLFLGKNKFYIPAVPTALMVVRFVFYSIQCMYIGFEASGVLQELLITVLCIYLFACGYSFSSNGQEELKITLISFSLITCLQVFISAVLYKFNKGSISSGIGMSNYAATFLLLAFTYLLFTKNRRLIDNISIAINLLGILVTQSFGAYLAVAIVVFIKLIKSFKWNRAKSWVKLLVIVAVLVVCFVVFSKSSFGKPTLEKILQKIEFLTNGQYLQFGSSRIELYEFSVNNFKRHWLLGAIENYDPALPDSLKWQYAKTHNILLESLVKYGVLGTIINCGLAIYILKNGLKKCRFDVKRRAILYTFLAVFIHGLIEPNFFTVHFDIFFWTMAGYLLSPGKVCNEPVKVSKLQKPQTILI